MTIKNINNEAFWSFCVEDVHTQPFKFLASKIQIQSHDWNLMREEVLLVLLLPFHTISGLSVKKQTKKKTVFCGCKTQRTSLVLVFSSVLSCCFDSVKLKNRYFTD